MKTTGSPLTESNRRPSPYHAHFRGFTARRAPPAGRWQALIWILPRPAASAPPQAIAPAAEQQPVRVHAQPAAAPARAWPASQARPVGLHAGQPRPGRLSTDGQTIFPIPPTQGPKTTLSRHFPTAREDLNQCAYLHLAGSHRRQPRSVTEPKDTAEHAAAQSQGTRPPERGQPTLVRPNLPMSGRSALGACPMSL